jgi:hypothetical protein
LDNNFLLTYGGYMYLGRPPAGKNSPLAALLPDPRILKLNSPYPLAFIELGAAGTPHRTSYVTMPPAETAESTGMCRIGSHDSVMCGWYMYHGGTNPRIPHWGPSAKRDEFGVSYDFTAPLSEYGYERPAYYLLRRFHQTLLNYSDRFCYGPLVAQDPLVGANEDKLRATVRMGTGDEGMLFISHYGNAVALSEREASFNIKTASGPVAIPAVGKLNLKNGDFAMLPINWDLGHGIKLVSSTAQPSGKIQNGDELVMICSTIHDQEGEVVLELPKGAVVTTTGTQSRQGEKTIVSIKPAMDALITIEAGGAKLVFAILPKDKILHSVEDTINGQKTYLISNQDLVVDGDSVRLTGKGVNHFELLSYPSVDWKGQKADSVGIFSRITAQVPEVDVNVIVEKYNHKKWLLKLPEDGFDGLNDIYANVDFNGLVCRIFNQNTGMLEGDQLWGRELDWKVGLKRFKECLAGEGLVFFANPADEASKKELSTDGMTLEEQRVIAQDSKINKIEFTPEYKLVLEALR